LFDAGVGVLDISSVYDVDGTDTATPSIAAVSDPSQAAYNARPYRFIRIQKAVEIPGQKIRKINNSAFGPANMGMREILGYAPIQPDGSVQIQIPANVPFLIDVVDVNAKRVTSLGRHTSWLQLLPGETRSCNGCHSTVNKTSHGRIGLTAAVNQGAPIAGQPFPNTNPTLTTQPNETMAQTLARITCVSGSTCSQLLSTDVLYTNIWTTGTTPAAADMPISYAYADLVSASPVTPLLTPSCLPWTAQCRVTIHYANDPVKQVFLQSIWNVPNRLAPDKVTPATCVTCHTTATAAANVLMVPQGQIDLTGGTSTADVTVVTSYEELLFPHNEQTLNMAGVPTDVLVPGPTDPVTGLPTTMPVVLPSPMTAGSAAASTAFLRMFDNSFHDPVLDHTGYLSPAELRLIVEWLDIGGQYYNDPFVAPVAN
jgi:Hydrazine synthase alpha subunit middle domain